MFGIGFPELVVIFVVALIVLGPERMPQMAKQLARWVNEVRKAADELKKELAAEEIEKGKDELEKVRQELLEKVYNPLPPEEDPAKAEKHNGKKDTPDERTP
ncbi:MAG: twin-arginine translocase subunit TatB [Thermodesulfobacteria bacterium]|nr:twin-arginine translocase subunit TatB [Thermodesulfobacteriota bacterium]